MVHYLPAKQTRTRPSSCILSLTLSPCQPPPPALSRAAMPDGITWHVNPAWLRASHLEVLLYPGAPSIAEQVQADRDAQAQALRNLPKRIRRQYARTAGR